MPCAALLVCIGASVGYVDAAEVPAKRTIRDATLLGRSWDVLEKNTDGSPECPWYPYRGCMPSVVGFRGVWNWDSAFIALALLRRDPDLAREQYRIMMKIQLDDGMLPDVIWRDSKKGVFTGCTKPPVWGWAIWTIDQVAPDETFLVDAYDSLVRYESFWRTRRFSGKDGLFRYDGNSRDEKERHLYCGWESGWDDSPRWDGRPYELYPIDLNCWMALYYRSLCKLAKRLGKVADASKWHKRGKALELMLEDRLWDSEDRCYYDWDFAKDAFSRVLTPASYMPLFIGAASKDHAAGMAVAAKRLMPGWPTVSYDHPKYNPTTYWRGRTWLNVAYIALKGLKYYGYDDIADAGKKTLLDWVEKNDGIYENYNSQTGEHLGCPLFSWSAAFVIKFIEDWDSPRETEMPICTAHD